MVAAWQLELSDSRDGGGELQLGIGVISKCSDLRFDPGNFSLSQSWRQFSFAKLEQDLPYATVAKRSNFRAGAREGSYSRKGVFLPSRCLLEGPFLEPLLRTLLRTPPPSNSMKKFQRPSKNPSKQSREPF